MRVNSLIGLISLFEKGLITEKQFYTGIEQVDLDGVESVEIEWDADNERFWVNVTYY